MIGKVLLVGGALAVTGSFAFTSCLTNAGGAGIAAGIAASEITACDTPGAVAAPIGVGVPQGANVASLNAAQTLVAAAIIQAAVNATTSAGHPEWATQAAVIGIMTGMQESTLRNLPGGDRDSVGVFQQRGPWAPFADRHDPATAAMMFYTGGRGGQRGLMDIRGWASMLPGEAAQAVQVSAFPLAYAQWEGLARSVVASLITGLPAQQDAPQAAPSPAPSTDAADCGVPADVAADGAVGPVGAPGADTSATPCPAGIPDQGIHKTARGNSIRVCSVSTFVFDSRGNRLTIAVNVSVAANMRAMVASAHADGIDLSGGGFRSFDDQLTAGRNNHCQGWPRWTSSSQCSPPTAPPGTSQHEQGLAVDYRMTSGVFTWLSANAATFGFKNWAPEPWHWSTTGH